MTTMIRSPRTSPTMSPTMRTSVSWSQRGTSFTERRMGLGVFIDQSLPLTLRAFRPGLQILFPTRNDMRKRYHLIDSDVAKLFYQTSSSQYYPAFERVFNRTVQVIEQTLEGNGR